MKKFSLFIVVALIMSFSFYSCEENKDDLKENETTTLAALPENFSIDIPNSISANTTLKSASKTTTSLKSSDDDVIDGNELYKNLRFYIEVVDFSANFVEEIIDHIKVIKQHENLVEFTFTGDDKRDKVVKLADNQSFEGKSYKHSLKIYNKSDNKLSFAIYWNNSPVDGVATCKPKIMNYNDDSDINVLYRVEYKENVSNYDKVMIVTATGIKLKNNTDLDKIKVFAGQKGDFIDIYGNSNHPDFYKELPLNANDKVGINVAFVSSCDTKKDISVCEIGLPKNNIDTQERNDILKDYSIKEYFIKAAYYQYVIATNNTTITYDAFKLLMETMAGNYFKNVNPPAYFNKDGFVQSGEAPNSEYTDITTRMDVLTPYSPKKVSEMTLTLE